jgi:hypothetical protein
VAAKPPPTPIPSKHSRVLVISTAGRNLQILTGHYYIKICIFAF